MRPVKIATAKRGLFEIREEWFTRPIDPEHVEVLIGVLKDGGTLPPLNVVKLESGALAVADGNHRFAAHAKFGSKEIPYRIVGRGESEIEWWLAAANRDHGKNRTDGEKRAAIERALTAPQGHDMSLADIARHCGVSEKLVRAVRAALFGAPSASADRRQRAEQVAAADPKASLAEIAKRAGVSKTTARRARERVRGTKTEDSGLVPNPEPERVRGTKTEDSGLVPNPEPEPRPEPPVTDEAPLPVEAEAPPEWHGVASACDRVAAAIVRVKRECSSELRTIPGGQEILDLLTRAHGIATRRKPERCPVANCAGAGCPVCGGKGYTLGPVKGADRIVAAAEVARG